MKKENLVTFKLDNIENKKRDHKNVKIYVKRESLNSGTFNSNLEILFYLLRSI